MPRVLITGATGLVGRAVCERLATEGYQLRAALRAPRQLPGHITESIVIGDIGAVKDWRTGLEGVDLVVHAAARTHVLETRENQRSYEATNVLATQHLAAAASSQGVRRFVYLSSIKVNGEESGAAPFEAADPPAPLDAYGRSKLAAEEVLRAAAGTMEVAIVRPPLVYGPGVQANFLRLMRWVDRERLLPFGAVHNQRSLINVWNLAGLIVRLLQHPRAAGQVWLVADDETVSTPQLVRRLAASLHRRARLLPVPPGLLRVAGRLTGQGEQMARLTGSLVVDCARTREALDWRPSVSLDEGLIRTAAWYRSL
jgi:nucleoside-diphosphate-sugar epimerase